MVGRGRRRASILPVGPLVVGASSSDTPESDGGTDDADSTAPESDAEMDDADRRPSEAPAGTDDADRGAPESTVGEIAAPVPSPFADLEIASESGTMTILYDSLTADGQGTVAGSAASPVINGTVAVQGQVTAIDPSFGEIQLPPFSVTGPPNAVPVTLRDVTCDTATGDFIPGINTAIDQAGGGADVMAAGTAVWDGRWVGPTDE